MATHDVEARFCRWLFRARDLSGEDVLLFTQEFLAEMLYLSSIGRQMGGRATTGRHAGVVVGGVSASAYSSALETLTSAPPLLCRFSCSADWGQLVPMGRPFELCGRVDFSGLRVTRLPSDMLAMFQRSLGSLPG